MLYVGTSKDLRSRVRTYFTASETRSRMGEMVGLAAAVEGIECATPLEAEIRELRLIAEHKPKYNRRSRFPERVHWIKVTVEPWPRLSLVTRVLDDGTDYLGPFSSKRVAERALAALHETFPVRQCAQRLPKTPSLSACALAEIGHSLFSLRRVDHAHGVRRGGAGPALVARAEPGPRRGLALRAHGRTRRRRAVRGGHVLA